MFLTPRQIVSALPISFEAILQRVTLLVCELSWNAKGILFNRGVKAKFFENGP